MAKDARLHLGINDRFLQNFIDLTLELELSGENRFVIYGQPEIPFTKSYSEGLVHFADTLEGSLQLDHWFENAGYIYIHFLSDEVVSYLNAKSLSGKKLIWLFWGSDGFSLRSIHAKMDDLQSGSLIGILRKSRDLVYVRDSEKAKAKLAFLKKIDYFGHYIEADYNLFKPFFTNCQFIFFTYGVAEQIVREIELDGNSILVGNSACPSNNHLYVLNKLIGQSSDHELILPLSYGGSEGYIQKVVQTGVRRYHRFKPLTNLMKLEEYTREVLSRSPFAIMYQVRSQAWGNIMQLLWQGSRVFMYKKNNLYTFLRHAGFHVSALSGRLGAKDLVPLDEQQHQENRKLIIENFGKAAVSSAYRRLLTIK